jgi:hypothetical protein
MRAGTRASQLAMQLRDRFSRHPKATALVGWQSYYRELLEESAQRVLVDHRGPHVGGDARQTELIEAVASGRRAVLVSAPRGCGKSRFALELARRLARAQRSWDVRFVRQDEPALDAELRELPTADRLILVVDDAQDCPALVQRLASTCAAQSSSQVHLVCLTRPTGRAALLEALASHFPAGEPLELDLGRPGAKVLRELIEALIPQLSPHHRDVIRRFVADSFFAAVLLCTGVARQKKLPQTLSTKHLREYAVRQPVLEAMGDFGPAEKAFRALAVFAASAPVPAGDAALRSHAATRSGLSVADLEVLERRILEAGLWAKDGRGLMRPFPDLVGDLILEETCLDEQGWLTPFGRELMRGLLEQRHYDQVIRNCDDIARIFSTAARVDFLSELLLEQPKAPSPQTRAEASELLEGCSRLAVRHPGLTVQLVDALTTTGVLRPVSPAPGLDFPDSPEACAQRLLMSAAESDPALVPRALEYSRQLLAGARAHEGASRAVLDDLTEFCRFGVSRPLTHATSVLDALDKWSKDSDAEAAELAASLVQGFLRLDMRAHRWEQGAPTLVSVGLGPTGEVCKLRDRALDILVRSAGHSSPAVAYAAARSLRHWAAGYPALTSEQRQGWEPQVTRESDRLAAAFGKLGSATAHLPVRAAVEQQGWQWWTDGPEQFIRRAGRRMLEALPEAQTYSLWKALHAAALPVFALPLGEAIEPRARHEQLQPLIEPSATRTADLARELFDRLDSSCPDARAWAALFAAAAGALPPQPLQPHAHLYLKEFVARHPEEAWSLVSEEVALGPLGAMLPALLDSLRRLDIGRWREAIQRTVPGTRLFELELRALCASSDLDDAEREMLAQGLQLEDPGIAHLAAQALLSGPPPTIASGLDSVLVSLPRRSADSRLWELALDAFARWGAPLLSAPADAEADPAIRAASGELLRLLRTSAGALSWEEGPHTRHLATVLAVFAVVVPHTHKAWLRQEWPASAHGGDSDGVLSAARISEFVRLLSRSSAASFWQKQFIEWMTDEPDLARLGARGLAALGGLGDPCIPPLVITLAQQPTDSSREALSGLLDGCAGSPRFLEDTLALLRQLVEMPDAYVLLETEVIAAMIRADRLRAGADDARSAALDAMDRAAAADLPQPVRQTLGRARQALQGALEEDLLRGNRV